MHLLTSNNNISIILVGVGLRFKFDKFSTQSHKKWPTLINIIEIHKIEVKNNAVYHCLGKIWPHSLTSNINISINLVVVSLRLKFDKFSTQSLKKKAYIEKNHRNSQSLSKKQCSISL